MGRAYNVIDADGHILEPLDLWDKYIDPKFRDRAPRIAKGENGKERLVIEEHSVGDGQRGIGRIGAVGARQGVVAADTMEYKDGKQAGSIRTSAFRTWTRTGSTPRFSIRASGSFRERSTTPSWP